MKREDDVIERALSVPLKDTHPLLITSDSFMIISYLSQSIAAGKTTDTYRIEQRERQNGRQLGLMIGHLAAVYWDVFKQTQLQHSSLRQFNLMSVSCNHNDTNIHTDCYAKDFT